MTYKHLLTQLQQLNEYQLNQDVTIFDCWADEYVPATELNYTTDQQSVLDLNHPFLKF